jgi:hypothetical protein
MTGRDAEDREPPPGTESRSIEDVLDDVAEEELEDAGDGDDDGSE